MNSYTIEIQKYLFQVKNTINKLLIEDINIVMNLLEATRSSGNSVFIMGNGGSSATASHFVCDFNKGISLKKQKRYKVICLNDNIPLIMAYANDISFEDVFVEQLKNFFKQGDIVIGISGSGNSKNVLRAIEFANMHGGVTIGFSGYDGGELKKLAQYNLHININNMQIVEDVHMILNHCIMKILSDDNIY
jgi:D-sedoheptulose 7-phosphate isomerase